VVGGIGEFINGIRSNFGRAGEFAIQNGFEYNNVYNSLLQYSVINAYMEKQNHELLQTQLTETELLREETNSANLRDTVTSCIFLSLLVIIGIGNLIVLIVQTCSRRQRRNHDDE
jgi:hypothetical protein